MHASFAVLHVARRFQSPAESKYQRKGLQTIIFLSRKLNNVIDRDPINRDGVGSVLSVLFKGRICQFDAIERFFFLFVMTQIQPPVWRPFERSGEELPTISLRNGSVPGRQELCTLVMLHCLVSYEEEYS
jgi:hypothetical protein